MRVGGVEGVQGGVCVRERANEHMKALKVPPSPSPSLPHTHATHTQRGNRGLANAECSINVPVH